MNRKESTMKVTTPKLRRMEGDDTWATKHRCYLCGRELNDLFSIPQSVQHIWVSASERPSLESVTIWVKSWARQYTEWGMSRTRINRHFHNAIDDLLMKQFDLSKPKKLYVTVEYEE